jgi:hypothetical protein
MTDEDLDNPLRVDNCEMCGAVHWADCVCSPESPHRVPTDQEIEAARKARLVRAELDAGKKGATK